MINVFLFSVLSLDRKFQRSTKWRVTGDLWSVESYLKSEIYARGSEASCKQTTFFQYLQRQLLSVIETDSQKPIA